MILPKGYDRELRSIFSDDPAQTLGRSFDIPGEEQSEDPAAMVAKATGEYQLDVG